MTDEKTPDPEEPTLPEYTGDTLHHALQYIQQHLVAPKGQYNDYGGFAYRSLEDIKKALKPFLRAVDGVCYDSDKVVRKGDRYYIEATVTFRAHGDSIDSQGWAREPYEKKGMDQSQISGTASSYARKYAYSGLFLIDDSKDPDTSDNRSEAARAAKTNMGGTVVDADKLTGVVDELISLIDEDNPDVDAAAMSAREMYEPLTNDERSFVNGRLRERKMTNPKTGRTVQYWNPLKTLLLHAAEIEK